ncbi:hypothetical protein [Burkholderia cenocepacia]|uniref:hypothetical protein n=1 Tax=Burkholderia cenocepacia TaxID=95486 RepID=UPI0021AE9012|nr:hypothetical protein [Burkholderia cenocepacia]
MTITEATVWELRLNDVPAAEVPEHVVRRIEHELAQERQWDLRVASILSYAGAVLCQLAYTALCIPLAIFAFAGLSWATNPAGFAHLAHQILNASETELRAVVDGLAWTAIGFSGMVLVMWHAFGGGRGSRTTTTKRGTRRFVSLRASPPAVSSRCTSRAR